MLITTRDVPTGSELGADTLTKADIPSGHKVARRAIANGDPVHRYNQVIGYASEDIAPGSHVHTHNMAMGEVAHDHACPVTMARATCHPIWLITCRTKA
ncbi:UxaA family hydrolase [Parahaliea mediterranea]|uniref:UxaA family hydrolase n=1 Tax=Parahaliea mediterranea TaxID=651086 RepID=A0A939DFH6_9GAMM|nr:UxaA family hydrolase [Parahaliea mediterranea]